MVSRGLCFSLGILPGFLLGLPLGVHLSSPTISSINKSVVVSKDFGGYVSLRGRWRSIAHAGSIPPELAKVTDISCSKPERACREAIASLRKIGPWGREFQLDVFSHHYIITEWSEQRIRGVSEKPVGDLEIRISLADRSAEKSWRETKARGSTSASEDVYEHYVLE